MLANAQVLTVLLPEPGQHVHVGERPIRGFLMAALVVLGVACERRHLLQRRRQAA